MTEPSSDRPRRPARRRTPFFGGSKQARFFMGPEAVRIAEAGLALRENGVCQADGTVGPASLACDADDATAGALPAGWAMALGGFCSGALGAVLASSAQIPGLRLAGPAPTPAQAAILARLGLGDAHLPLTAPRRFARLLFCAALPAAAVPAGPTYLALMARLRDPPAATVPFAAAILPPPTGRRQALRNRASLAGWLRARRVRLLNPDDEDFAALAAALARTTLLIIADPAQAGLLGLCPKGTKILEIAPEGWAGPAIRGFAAALGLDWSLFLGSALSYPLSSPLPFGAATALAYDVPIATFSHAMSVI
jgi:hypothetical protein